MAAPERHRKLGGAGRTFLTTADQPDPHAVARRAEGRGGSGRPARWRPGPGGVAGPAGLHDRGSPAPLAAASTSTLGKVPPGGGWRTHGRSEQVRGRGNGWAYVQVAIDDRTRIAYCEVLLDEKGPTCAAFLHRATQWLHDTHGVTVERVLTDNAIVYRRGAEWVAGLLALQIKRRFIKPRCPWTNGKAERFNWTLQSEWAYATGWTSNDDRTAALTSYLQRYNTERGRPRPLRSNARSWPFGSAASVARPARICRADPTLDD